MLPQHVATSKTPLANGRATRSAPTGVGTRPLRRAIQRYLEDALSEKILWKEFHAGETILVEAEGEEFVFRAIEGVEPPPVEMAGSGSEG